MKTYRCYNYYYSLPNPPMIFQAEYEAESDYIFIHHPRTDNYSQWWSVVFHELIHREIILLNNFRHLVLFDDEDYEAFTEIICECGSAVLSRHTGIYEQTREFHIEFIKEYKNLLKERWTPEIGQSYKV